jgi:YHS domain-containing protein
MVRLILWAILILFLVRALARLTRGMLDGAGYRRDRAAPSVGLVKDPVCGVFVVPSKALTSGAGAAVKYFCSEKCRQAWISR